MLRNRGIERESARFVSEEAIAKNEELPQASQQQESKTLGERLSGASVIPHGVIAVQMTLSL